LRVGLFRKSFSDSGELAPVSWSILEKANTVLRVEAWPSALSQRTRPLWRS
jgi:hypothetical protein